MTSQTALASSADASFELTLDGDAIDPKEMLDEWLRRQGRSSRGWQHIGSRIRGRQTRRFLVVEDRMLAVRTPYSFGGLQAIRGSQYLCGYQHPEDQWLKPFQAAFPGISVSIARPAWRSPSGRVYIPHSEIFGAVNFTASEDVLGWSYWLVESRS